MKKNTDVDRVTNEVTRPPINTKSTEINFELCTSFWNDFFEMLDIEKDRKKIARTSKYQYRDSKLRNMVSQKRANSLSKKSRSHRA